jgi:CheY-like chemotaxis protein
MAIEILIADPNKAAHKAFEEVFRGTGYNVTFSENGEDALLKMRSMRPALVIADVTMSDKSGKELCQMLKGDPDLSKVPFVLLGGPFDEDLEEERNQVKADGAITKPLKREPILSLVDGLLAGEPVSGIAEAVGGMAQPVEGTPEPFEAGGKGEEEILELHGIEEATNPRNPGGEEEVIELVDIVEEPAAKPEEAPPSGEKGEPEEGGFFGEGAVPDLEFSEDMELPKDEEIVQVPEAERPEAGPEAPEVMDVKEELAKVFPEADMAELGGIEEEITGPPEETPETEKAELASEEFTEELPTEELGEVPEDLLKEKGLEEALAEEIGELPLEETPEAEKTELASEEFTEELPTEGLGEVPEDLLKEKGLEEALAEEIEELPVDLLGEKEQKETPGERRETLAEGEEELPELEGLIAETELLREEEEVLEEALKELPGEAPETGELEELPEMELPTEELETPPQEMDLEGLAQKVLTEDELEGFGAEVGTEEGLEEPTEEVFGEGELEKLAEEATRDQDGEEIPEGALAEAIEEFTGETVRGEEEGGVQPIREKSIEQTISAAVKELVEGMSAKILPQLTEAIASAATERIEKAVQKLVPEMAEKAIQKEIRRLENLKKGEDLDV